MARRSARLASSQGSQQSSPASAPQSSPPSASRKRKAESGSSPSAKRGKKNEKEQKTIEESMDIDKDEEEPPKPQEKETETGTKPAESSAKQDTVAKDKEEAVPKQDNKPAQPSEKQDAATDDKQDEPPKPQQSNGHTEEPAKPDDANKKEDKTEPTQPAEPEKSTHADTDKSKEEPQSSSASKTNGNAVEPSARSGEVPSSILEKGIFYFLYRGRVNIDSPTAVEDIARSHLVLRPLPHGAKISDGSIGDDKNCRLIAIPKKMLPISGKDRWTAFVETANTSFKELKESFMKSDDYTTQSGPRHTPAATPVAEGVYAITTTGRESHLAYILTLPEKLGDVQNDLGLRQQGSFILSVKNPKAPGPANADIGKDPGYSQELQNEFRSLRWAPLKPDHLNYEGCQFLMVGEGEKGLEKATEPQEGDEKKEETPKEELKKLEDEDEIRVEHLNGEDAVFADLGTNAKDYPSLQTTW